MAMAPLRCFGKWIPMAASVLFIVQLHFGCGNGHFRSDNLLTLTRPAMRILVEGGLHGSCEASKGPWRFVARNPRCR